jgi:hypothetical protein
MQCSTCEEYVLAHGVMQQVERILSSTDERAEIEVVRYAA